MGPFFKKLTIILGACLALQILWMALNPAKDFPYAEEKIATLKQARNQKYDFVYFVDSTNIWGSSKEKPSMISSFIQQYSGFTKPLIISRPGDHLSDFYSAMKALDQLKATSKVAVFTINMRSFGPEWNYQYFYEHKWDQFIQENIRFKQVIDLFIPFITGFSDLNKPLLEKAEFARYPIYYQGKKIGKAQSCADLNEKKVESELEFSKEKVQFSLICNYGQKITASHRRLADIQKIVRFSKKTGQKVFFYLTPINYQLIRQYQLTDVESTLNHNKQLITDYLNREHVPFADYSQSLQAEDFDWGQGVYPNEHLHLTGREKLGKNIAMVIKTYKTNQSEVQ